MTIECSIDLTRAPFLREMLGVVTERRFSKVETEIMARLAILGDRSAWDIMNGSSPALEEMEAWFAMIRLEKDRFIYRDIVGCHLWRITGCGRLAVTNGERDSG